MKNNLSFSKITPFILLLAGTPVLAAQATGTEPAWSTMAMSLLGGLALFLFGMEEMSQALKAAAGSRMKYILGRLTTNRFSGAVTGALVTAVIQSSSVTTVLVVGFVSAGLMSLSQSIGVIMGANIGTTITAQIIAFKVTKLALALIALGFSVRLFSRHDRLRQYGGMILGLGLVFFGMNVMGEAMTPLRTYQPFLALMEGLTRPVLGILLGAFFTAVLQSSSATTGIIIVMAGQGLISLEGGIALALGANIGTCVTALLATIGKQRPAVRVALVHILFNVFGVLLWVGFIDHLAAMAVGISPAHAELSGSLRLAAEVPRQIANANTLFNVINTLIFIGFTAPLAWLVTRLLPDRQARRTRIIEPRYLSRPMADTPALGLHMVHLEIGHLGEQLQGMLGQARLGLEKRDERLFQGIKKQDDAVDILYAEIVGYLSRMGKLSLTTEESEDYYRLSQAGANLERIGDVLETDISATGQKMLAENLRPSSTMETLVMALFQSVSLALETTLRAVVESDEEAARQVLALRRRVEDQCQAALKHQAGSLAHNDETRLATLNIEFELIDKLKRIYSLCKRITRLLIPDEVS